MASEAALHQWTAAPLTLPLLSPFCMSSPSNMYYVPLGLFAGAPSTWLRFLFNNLFPVAVGHIVSGSLLVALPNFIVNGPPFWFEQRAPTQATCVSPEKSAPAQAAPVAGESKATAEGKPTVESKSIERYPLLQGDSTAAAPTFWLFQLPRRPLQQSVAIPPRPGEADYAGTGTVGIPPSLSAPPQLTSVASESPILERQTTALRDLAGSVQTALRRLVDPSAAKDMDKQTLAAEAGPSAPPDGLSAVIDQDTKLAAPVPYTRMT